MWTFAFHDSSLPQAPVGVHVPSLWVFCSAGNDSNNNCHSYGTFGLEDTICGGHGAVPHRPPTTAVTSQGPCSYALKPIPRPVLHTPPRQHLHATERLRQDLSAGQPCPRAPYGPVEPPTSLLLVVKPATGPAGLPASFLSVFPVTSLHTTLASDLSVHLRAVLSFVISVVD